MNYLNLHNATMKIIIDRGKWIGCDLCEGICGGLFQIGYDGKAYVKNSRLIIYCVKKAVNECLADAVILEKRI